MKCMVTIKGCYYMYECTIFEVHRGYIKFEHINSKKPTCFALKNIDEVIIVEEVKK